MTAYIELMGAIPSHTNYLDGTMTIEFLTSDGEGRLPFAKEFLDENPKADGKAFQITSVVQAKSKKGYMLITNSFCYWLWNNSTEVKTLLPMLEKWVSGEEEGKELLIKLTKKSPSGGMIGIEREKPVTWNKEGNDFTTLVF